MLVLSLLLCLGLTMAQSDQEPHFEVFLPSVLHYPAEELICFHVEEDKGKFSSLIANMKSESGTIKLHEVKDTEREPFSCGTFQVPRPSGTQEKVTVEVRGVTSPDSSQYLSSQSVTIRMKNNGTFIQTDKTVYKPGQEVKVRIIKLNQDMEASNEMHPLITLEDPNRNRMAQFKNVVPKSGIVDLSYQLDRGAALGSYSIIAEEKKMFFSVEEYVLPRYDVNVLAPPVSVMDKELTITICAKYNYGQPVPGNVTYKACQKKQRYWRGRLDSDEDQKDLCHHHTDKTDEFGCLKSNMDFSPFKLRDSRYERNLDVEASMEEEGTGIRINATAKKIEISSQITKISFKDTKKHFHPGAPYRGKVLLESFNGKPLRGQKVHLTISVNGDTTKETYETDSNGEVSFKLPTTTWGKDSVSIRAFTDDSSEEYERNRVAARYGSDSLQLEGMYMNSDDSVHIRPVRSNAACHENVTVQVDYNHGGGKTKRSTDSILKKFFYLVLSRSKIIYFGMKTLNVGNSYGTLDISLPLRDISPNGKMLVFTVDESGGMAADTTTFQVTPCLKQNVTLGFSEDKVLPGSPVNVNLRAEPGSMCALRVVDTSVAMMNPDGELTQAKIQNLVKPDPYFSSHERLDYDLCRNTRPTDSRDMGSDIDDFWPRYYSYPVKKKDIQDIIQGINLSLLHNWNIVAPVTCAYERGAYGVTANINSSISD
uniref:Alpha-2-macroglobulin bait region domain-containing protein n=1 Tax=Leptobrachium leishanense TaxID=445787 RepID=A0A8C5QZY6_9ANUR